MSDYGTNTSSRGGGYRLLAFAAAHPWLPIVLGIAYFLWVALNHEAFGLFIGRTFDMNDRPKFNRFFLRAGMIGVSLYLLTVLPFFLRRKNIRAIVYLAMTLLLTTVAVYGLVVVYSELVHFPQYMLLAILLFPALRSYHFTLVICSVLGAIDEGIQYWYLSPQRTDYFDFNDVVLNMLGSAWGLLALGAWLGKNYDWAIISIRKSGVLVLSVLFLLALAWSINLLDFVPADTAQNPAAWTLVRQEATGFWTDIPLGRRFHILRPGAGLSLLLALTLFYLPLDSILRK